MAATLFSGEGLDTVLANPGLHTQDLGGDTSTSEFAAMSMYERIAGHDPRAKIWPGPPNT